MVVDGSHARERVLYLPLSCFCFHRAIGKSTLLKMIANNLHKSKDHVVGGTVSLTGVSPAKDVIWTNLVSYIDQIDRLHPFLTVFETCKFAWLCRTGGTHRKPYFGQGEEVDETIKKMDDELFIVNKILDAVGLTRVKDTFVGGEGIVRGVSGGEKKRVTVAEMLCIGTPIICCDEISTGLDGMFIS
jgi:ABC-type multidrug transport system ATPase subunit